MRAQRYIPIDSIDDFITNIDLGNAPENVAIEMRGFRTSKGQMVGVRDFGTKHRYLSYPSMPSAITILDARNLYLPEEGKEYDIVVGLDTGGNTRIFIGDGIKDIAGSTAATPIVMHVPGHGYETNDIVYQDRVDDHQAANGKWTITVVDSDHYSLNGSVGVSGSMAGGLVCRWFELTEYYSGVVTTGDSTASTLTLGTVKDGLAGTVLDRFAPANYLKGYICFKDSGSLGYAGLITSSTAMSSNAVTLTFVNTNGSRNVATGDTVKIFRCTGILPDDQLGGGRGYQFNNGSTPHLRFLDVEAQQKMNMYYGPIVNDVIAPKQPLQLKKGKFLSGDVFTIGGYTTGWRAFFSTTSETITSMSKATTADGFKRVWFTAGTKIYATHDQGAGTWITPVLQKESGRLLKGIMMYDNGAAIGSLIGYAVGQYGTILKTTDGGTTWGGISHATVGTTELNCLHVLNGTTLWIGGNGGKIFYSTNSFTACVSQTTGTTDHIVTVSFADANTGWFGTAFTSSVGFGINKTVNAGTAWTTVSSTQQLSIFSISATDTTHAFAVSSNPSNANLDGTYYTSNGSTWTKKSAFTGRSVVGLSNDVAKVGSFSGILYSIANATTSFDLTQDTTEISQTLVAQAYFSATDGFAAGYSGAMIRLSGANGVQGSGSRLQWQANKAGMQPDMVTVGSAQAPVAYDAVTSQNNTIEKEIGEGLKLTLTLFEQTGGVVAGTAYFVRMYVTILYADHTYSTFYQESDPIAHIFLKPRTTDAFTYIKPTIAINPAIANGNIIGFRFYQAQLDGLAVGVNISQWQESSSEYVHAFTLLTSSVGWSIDTASRYAYKNQIDEFSIEKALLFLAGSVSTIRSNLGHVPVTTRAYLSPRFAVKLGRSQGAVHWVDQDDRTLRRSAYNGSSVHMEDSFPDISLDNSNENHRLELLGRGELYGLACKDGNILALHPSELEVRDLISEVPEILPIDLVSRRSITGSGITDAPAGIAWAGQGAIYAILRGGFKALPLNLNLKNVYDGTKLLTNGTPIVTDAYRKNILAGYDRFYGELYFQIQQNKEGGGSEWVSYRYNEREQRWSTRVFNVGATGEIRGLYSKKDNTLVIVTSTGLLKYPNREATVNSHQWEEEVDATGFTANKGIPTLIKINCGSVFSLNNQISPVDLHIDYNASSSDLTRSFYVKLFSNFELSAFDTKGFPMDEKPSLRGVAPRGMIRSLQIEIGLDATNVENAKNLEISRVEIGVNEHAKIGVT